MNIIRASEVGQGDDKPARQVKSKAVPLVRHCGSGEDDFSVHPITSCYQINAPSDTAAPVVLFMPFVLTFSMIDCIWYGDASLRPSRLGLIGKPDAPLSGRTLALPDPPNTATINITHQPQKAVEVKSSHLGE